MKTHLLKRGFALVASVLTLGLAPVFGQQNCLVQFSPFGPVTIKALDAVSLSVSPATGSPVAAGNYAYWCIDITSEHNGANDAPFFFPFTYNGATLYSACDPNLTAYPELKPYSGLQNLSKVNYILNHKQGSHDDVQDAIWFFVGGPPMANPLSAASQAMIDAANANPDFSLQCGDVVAVIVEVPPTKIPAAPPNYPHHTGPGHIQLVILELPVPCIPCISVSKTIACLEPTNTLADFGKVAAGFKGNDAPQFAYGISVTNCGTIPLTNLTVIDNMFGDITTNLFVPGTVLEPGDSATYYYSAGLAENTTNTVTVTGQSSKDGSTVQASDSAIALVDTASISANITVSASCDEDGDANDDHVQLSACASNCPVTYTLTICNNGSANLTDVSVNSAEWTALGLPLPVNFDLPAGQCKTFQQTVVVQCPGKTVNVDVSAKVQPDSGHCAVYDSTGTNVITVSDSTSAVVECNPGNGSLCGYVFLDCDGSGDLSGGDAGLKAITVYLKNAANMIVATNQTDASGSYCFYDVTPGTYKVVVAAPSGYTETAGSCKPQWKDRYGRHCWNDNDGCTHWKQNGVDCWRSKDGCTHYKDSYGRDCWNDRYGRFHCQPCNYTSCNAPKNNEETVVVTACGAEANVNFCYAGTNAKAVCEIKGPSSAYCGDTVTYTCTIKNTGNACFSSGCDVTVCGKSYYCPPLEPGKSCSFDVKCTFSSWDAGNYSCKAVANCHSSFGTISVQSYCNTQVKDYSSRNSYGGYSGWGYSSWGYSGWGW